MAEAIVRRHRRKTNRWMPHDKKIVPWNLLKNAALVMMQGVPGYLLACADILGIPSGFHAAYGLALAATGHDVRPTILGAAMAMLMKWLMGASPGWAAMVTLMVVAAASMVMNGRGTVVLMTASGLAMLPCAIAGCLGTTAAVMLQGWAAVMLSGLSAPVMARAIIGIKGKRQLSAMEDRIAAGYLTVVCLCGGARMMLAGVNIGVFLSGSVVLAMALVLGPGAATIAGMLTGMMLSLQKLPLVLSIALAMGGFLAGMASSLGKRRISCGAFAVAAYLPLLLCGATGMGVGAAVLTAALLMGILPRGHYEWVQQLLRRFLNNDPAPGDAYASAVLTAWEQTVAAMARAVPSPGDARETRDGAWWQERLCQGCPEADRCGCLNTDLGINKAETVWAYRHAQEEIWQGALEHLRGMGCQRLYYLLDGMNALRREDEAAQRVMRQAQAQRSMLVTHLAAMSGAARRFAALSGGESWWDDMAARRIRKELSERAVPVTLSYVRRIKGHIQAAFELEHITGARKQADELCLLTSCLMDVPMQLHTLDGDRVVLTECPILHAEVGIAAEAITGCEVCGDAAWDGVLQDGRYLVALSDGMGHGELAAFSSRQAVELIRLCLDAGYSRQQTLTAVNGMLLLGGGGERFATADVLTIDLWKGQASLDKLGAAASWIFQKGMLTRLTGDALPLGILEEIDLSGSMFRLAAGDAVVLVTDGVEDAFGSCKALEEALNEALMRKDAAAAAEYLMDTAFAADAERRRDDQSVVVVRLAECRSS